jgi:uncharacterized damage-inducible protein DinB
MMNPKELFKHWELIRIGLISTIQSFEEEELAYTPFTGSWSAGEIMLHIANAEEGWLQYAVAREIDEWPVAYSLEDFPEKDSIIKKLNNVHDWTEEYLSRLTEEDLTSSITTPWGDDFPILWILWHLVEHEIHHRGELSLILGILGREGCNT